MANLTVVAKVVAKKESIEALKAELIKLIPPTRKEEGCIEYRLHQDNHDPAVFIFYENWQNKDALDRHMASPHFTAYVKATEPLMADKAVNLLTGVE
ncbi:putative quinol monooxygenase [Geotalea toluenoxydans]|uniref:putative quinol monooxygenase n=1 Tax=Geotalea toluenoxydans TaxID=421624 RepID=UPI0006D19A16|nr:putative quinol monooxygenase [Geotalea toluenoxydans]